ncbi:MAG: carboxypeptidase regulatory-like domain-containing protein [Micropruina sp.]|nr:carboxypeptidase regulatory-like domain-containing protein [Micropruina sp.]
MKVSGRRAEVQARPGRPLHRLEPRRAARLSGEGRWHRPLQATEPRKVGIIIPGLHASIGDYVWYDANYNGEQDAGELPARGVKVMLKDKDGNVVGTTTTDADGYYWFQNLTEKAAYTLEFEQPSGYTWTTQNSGADRTDSDVDPTTSTIRFNAPTWVEGVSRTSAGTTRPMT